MNDVEIEQERLERGLVKTGRGVAFPPECDGSASVDIARPGSLCLRTRTCLAASTARAARGLFVPPASLRGGASPCALDIGLGFGVPLFPAPRGQGEL